VQCHLYVTNRCVIHFTHSLIHAKFNSIASCSAELDQNGHPLMDDMSVGLSSSQNTIGPIFEFMAGSLALRSNRTVFDVNLLRTLLSNQLESGRVTPWQLGIQRIVELPYKGRHL
jgi:hypothetical protein